MKAVATKFILRAKSIQSANKIHRIFHGTQSIMMAIPYHDTVTAYDAFPSQRMVEQFAFILQTPI